MIHKRNVANAAAAAARLSDDYPEPTANKYN